MEPTPPSWESQDWQLYRTAAEILYHELQEKEKENRTLRQRIHMLKHSSPKRLPPSHP